VLVDLLRVKPALLQRYLGRDAAATIRAFHAAAPTPDVDRALPARARPHLSALGAQS
jgi:hypothetical protein